LAEFKKKHPKMVAHLLKKDSINFIFPFPKRDKIRGIQRGLKFLLFISIFSRNHLFKLLEK
ncbi:hypothetical protein, partial [Tenacibaculum maritimum]|uniref:hypothetical protein n=1 Tax=Tenacibaculum maritimum TaxID=107401 RepID=UPI003875DD97